ncbi:hypothetical protein HMPREF9374_1145 [Desmospora sp. 8437]|nr:hypothetical protein HMPREF9374_1145 [Desmospora sp. 8437]
MEIKRSFEHPTLGEALKFMDHAEALQALDLKFSMNLQVEEKIDKSFPDHEFLRPVYIVEVTVEAD